VVFAASEGRVWWAMLEEGRGGRANDVSAGTITQGKVKILTIIKFPVKRRRQMSFSCSVGRR
jgi:hypothetical protein